MGTGGMFGLGGGAPFGKVIALSGIKLVNFFGLRRHPSPFFFPPIGTLGAFTLGGTIRGCWVFGWALVCIAFRRIKAMVAAGTDFLDSRGRVTIFPEERIWVRATTGIFRDLFLMRERDFFPPTITFIFFPGILGSGEPAGLTRETAGELAGNGPREDSVVDGIAAPFGGGGSAVPFGAGGSAVPFGGGSSISSIFSSMINASSVSIGEFGAEFSILGVNFGEGGFEKEFGGKFGLKRRCLKMAEISFSPRDGRKDGRLILLDLRRRGTVNELL